MHLLGSADEAHRGHAVAPSVERLLGGLDHLRMVGQAEVVVGAEVQDLTLQLCAPCARPADGNHRALRAADHALRLLEAGASDLLKLLVEVRSHSFEHQALQLKTIFPQCPEWPTAKASL